MTRTDSPPSAQRAPFLHAGTGSGSELWLVRHAEVHEDWQGRAYGDLDVPLSDGGAQRTRELIPILAALGPTLVVTSPLSRAHQLGSALAQAADVPLMIEPDLREVNRGTWQGMRVRDLMRDAREDVRAFYADPWTWRGHGGESDALLSARAWAVVARVLAKAGGGRVVMTTHYNVIRVLAAGALGIPAPSSFAFRVDPGRLSLFVDRPGGWVLAHSNAGAPPRVDAEDERA